MHVTFNVKINEFIYLILSTYITQIYLNKIFTFNFDKIKRKFNKQDCVRKL